MDYIQIKTKYIMITNSNSFVKMVIYVRSNFF